jgi:hypothetical protein
MPEFELQRLVRWEIQLEIGESYGLQRLSPSEADTHDRTPGERGHS